MAKEWSINGEVPWGGQGGIWPTGGGGENIDWPPGGGNAFGGDASATVAINTIINQIIDAATLSNMPSGFIDGWIGDDDEVDDLINDTSFGHIRGGTDDG